ncbi:hypothetical protein [Kitasatospora sp. NPDC088134]|uniref:hypothetical protein n=1 Tax=Kitasatospora sp. NPDC088134 TaxID=3364071 RepID=UPI003806051E
MDDLDVDAEGGAVFDDGVLAARVGPGLAAVRGVRWPGQQLLAGGVVCALSVGFGVGTWWLYGGIGVV